MHDLQRASNRLNDIARLLSLEGVKVTSLPPSGLEPDKHTISEIASRAGVSKKTIARIIARYDVQTLSSGISVNSKKYVTTRDMQFILSKVR